MTALWIVLGILAALGLIGSIPLGVTAVYDQDGPQADAVAGPIHIRLYPRPTKAPQETQKKEKKQKKPKKQKESAPEPDQKKKQPLGGKLPMFRELIAMVLEAQAAVRNKLRIRELTLHLTVGGQGDDPAKAAMLYGSAWAALGNLLPLLHRAFRIQQQDIDAAVDFNSAETTIYAKATAVISLGAILRMGVYYGLRGLTIYRRHTKKGGNDHGTSNQ